MRAQEFITEANVVKTVQVGIYSVAIDQHFVDRIVYRKVKEVDAFSTLDKLPQTKAKLKDIFPGQSFWLHDNTNDVSLGIKTINQEKKEYLLKTAVPNRPWGDNNYPIIEVR